MNRLTRDVFVQRTQDLLLRRGGVDVSLSSVLQACGANKGSLYHFFPNGKDELLVAAMQQQAECALSSNKAILESSSTTSEAVVKLLQSLAKMVESKDCPEVLPFSAVGATSEEAGTALREICATTLETLQRLYADSLRVEGVSAKTARSLASVIVSTVEGSLLQSRTRRTSLPLKTAAIHLRDFISQHTDG